MSINKYEFRLVGHGKEITEEAVNNILEDLKTIVKPYNDIIDIDYFGNEATILLYSKSKVKKNQDMSRELTTAVCFKHLRNFSRMYKKINDIDCGYTIFHGADNSKYQRQQVELESGEVAKRHNRAQLLSN